MSRSPIPFSRFQQSRTADSKIRIAEKWTLSDSEMDEWRRKGTGAFKNRLRRNFLATQTNLEDPEHESAAFISLKLARNRLHTHSRVGSVRAFWLFAAPWLKAGLAVRGDPDRSPKTWAASTIPSFIAGIGTLYVIITKLLTGPPIYRPGRQERIVFLFSTLASFSHTMCIRS
jgi:hypothetical protein